MDYTKIIESLTTYLTEHSELKTKQVYEIYNQWALATGLTLRSADKVQWVLDYISDLKDIHPAVLEDAVRKQ